jgi:hypothetical protein
MEYAFEDRELADNPDAAPRCSPPLWWKGCGPGRPTATRTVRWGLDELDEYVYDKVGAASDLVLLPGVHRFTGTGPASGAADLLAPAPADGLDLPGDDRRRESVAAGGDEAVLDHGTGFIGGVSRPRISRSAWALMQVATRRARHRSASPRARG